MGVRHVGPPEHEGRLLMGVRARIYVRFLVVFAVIGGLGIAASIYTLVHERFELPFQSTYTVRAQFTAADGVISGLGQPVNVVGVKVGQVTGAALKDGVALVTMQIDRHQLKHIYADASAVLSPITPLDDMQINLSPGSARSGVLRNDGVIGVGSTTAPVQLSDLLSTLDADTRDYLSSLISSVGQGADGTGPAMHRVLNALGPTAYDTTQVSKALAARRTELARLVHNLAIVTRAASQDHQLAALVKAGDQTLHTLAQEQAPLRSSIAQLPATLSTARATLQDLEPFASQLGPTLTALSPAVKRLPATLRSIKPLATEGVHALRDQIRPLIDAAQPLVSALKPAVRSLNSSVPELSQSFQALDYFTNELTYNPNQGSNQGFMFWLAWFVHNFNSVVSVADANGGIGRASPLVTCDGLQDIPVLSKLLNLGGICPQ
jgi:phospholipid/cholesterol/gamma-HCH transport system substrate-binding protein